MSAGVVDRSERAQRICRRLADAVSRDAPAGLGAWDGAWALVEEPSNRFLDALDRWERTGAEEDQYAVQEAADAVAAAWAEAARQWEAAGRPKDWPTWQEVMDAR